MARVFASIIPRKLSRRQQTKLMKIIRKAPTPAALVPATEDKITPVDTTRYVWKILLVDDDADIRTLTRISLRDFIFANRELQFIEASSAAEAQQLLQEHTDIAVALVDVVMETDDAGLRLVEYIRNTLGNTLIRLVIRTGQPGIAPERYVIDHYDIDDYTDKTELTAARLYTTLRSAIKAYRDLQTIDTNRLGLEHILESTPNIYRIGGLSHGQFLNGILTQVIGLCRLSHSSYIGSLEGIVATFNHGETKVHASTEMFANNQRFNEIHQQCISHITQGEPSTSLREKAEIIPLVIANEAMGYIYIEPIESLSATDRGLIRVFARQCSQALENHELHGDIVKSFENAIDMLAQIAEYKDKATGDHVNRVDYYTREIAIAMGVEANQARIYGRASRLHDVGKVGIPDELLAKPGKLSPEEFELIKKHTTIGATILGHDPAFALAREIALHHHERWDGSGYPNGLLAKDLPLCTRIVSVADVFDAMISWRPYKKPWQLADARAAIAEGAGVQFDPAIVKAFLQVLDSGRFDALIKMAEHQA